VRKFEHTIVGAASYKRPTALVTPRMVEEGKKKMEELGLISALDRRILDSRDLSAADAIFTHRPKATKKDIFVEIGEEHAKVNLQELEKVERIGIDDFIEKVVPKATGMRVLFERHQLGNLVTLTGPQDPEANNLMAWDNSFGWSYTGGVADSIKQRVKEAGGNVDGWMRVSLSWYNHDDLDLHLWGEGEHIYYGNKVSHGLRAALDVDMNAGGGTSRTPVENIHVRAALPKGAYEVKVHQFAARETRDPGFELEIEVNGETRNFGAPVAPRNRAFTDPVKFDVDSSGQVVFKESAMSNHANGMVKWGLKTGKWHNVRALTLSPNHWTKPQGNKHWFFLLDGALSDEATRPFYNEFLTPALAAERKVCEVLANKIQVAPAEGAELSGLGFSETIRNHVYVEVDGAFKRTLKVVF